MSIEVSALSFSYGGPSALSGITFDAREGELLAILGPNGAGKSTLFRCMLGLLQNYSGSCRISGRDTKHLRARELAKLVSYIPQSHYPAFNYSVFDMVLMGTTSTVPGIATPGKDEVKRAGEALEYMGLGGIRDRGYTHISGGERQLVLIARALVQNTKVLIMDEPTSNLDYGNKIKVLERVRSLSRAGYTVIQSTHSPEDAFRYADKVLAIQGGEVIGFGDVGSVLNEELINRLYGVKVRIIRPDVGTPVCVPLEKGEK